MKKKLKFFYRIFGVLLTFVVVFNFFIGASESAVYYYSIEELQADFPDYYYFDLEEKEFFWCRAEYKKDSSGCFRKKESEREYDGFNIFYQYKTSFGDTGETNYTNYTHLRIGCLFNYSVTFNDGDDIVFIDGIKCLIRKYYSESSMYGDYLYSVEINFTLENSLYYFQIDGYCYENQKEAVVEHLLAIAEPAMLSRYKPMI